MDINIFQIFDLNGINVIDYPQDRRFKTIQIPGMYIDNIWKSNYVSIENIEGRHIEYSILDELDNIINS